MISQDLLEAVTGKFESLLVAHELDDARAIGPLACSLVQLLTDEQGFLLDGAGTAVEQICEMLRDENAFSASSTVRRCAWELLARQLLIRHVGKPGWLDFPAVWDSYVVSCIANYIESWSGGDLGKVVWPAAEVCQHGVWPRMRMERKKTECFTVSDKHVIWISSRPPR